MKTTDITWNFEKFLIDGNGKPRYRFHPSVAVSAVLPFVAGLIEESKRGQSSSTRSSTLQNIKENMEELLKGLDD